VIDIKPSNDKNTNRRGKICLKRFLISFAPKSLKIEGAIITIWKIIDPAIIPDRINRV